MAVTLSAPNFKDNNIIDTAKVAVDANAGQPVFQIDNPDPLSAHDYILIGRRGGSMSKIYQIASIAGSNVTLTTNLEFFSERGQEVTKLFGNQIKIYTAPYVAGQTPTTFTPLTGGSINIVADRAATAFTDPAGTDKLWYKFTYFNTYTSGETALADSVAARDMRANAYCTIAAIRRDAGFDDAPEVLDEDLAFHRQAAQSEVDGALAGKYVLPFSQPVDPQIVNITKTLAAGYAMISEFGTFDGMDKTKGEKKRDDARAQLKLLQSGSSILVGVDGISDVLSDAGGFSSGYSSDDEAMFTKDMISGYWGRDY